MPRHDPPRDPQGSIDPAAPTRAAPGSEEKILVLAARARAGLPLFHPGDSRGAAKKARGDGDLPAGVSYDPAKGTYEVRVGRGEARAYVGRFDDLAVAERALALARGGDLAGARALANGGVARPRWDVRRRKGRGAG